jgi:hypothetical protein
VWLAVKFLLFSPFFLDNIPNKTEEFEYTHYEWQRYGRAKILELKRNYLKFFDPGFIRIIPGYSSADLNNYWELEPVNY